jgi:Xaa-Pro aminopeptidase
MQAEGQLSPEWTLMRAGTPGVPSVNEWLKETLPQGARIGIDPVIVNTLLHVFNLADNDQDTRCDLSETIVHNILVH